MMSYFSYGNPGGGMDIGDNNKLDEILDRVRRIETRLCVLMERHGLHPMSNGTFGEVADNPADDDSADPRDK